MTQSPTPLRILLIEDSQADADVLVATLRRGGFAPTVRRVWTRADARQWLVAERWDLIIADYHLPGWNGLAAVALVRELGLDLPFILVSGVIGEEAAAEVMREGAHDFFLKQRLSRLPLAITRELEQAHLRRMQRRHAVEQQFLAGTGAILGDSMDYHRAIRGLVDHAVVGLATFCSIDIVLESEVVQRTFAGPWPQDVPVEWPRDRAPAAIGRTLATAEPFACRDATTADWTELGLDAPHATLLHQACGMLVCAPLVARNNAIGAMTIGYPRVFDDTYQERLEVTCEIARRCALAIDNGRLLAEVYEGHRRLTRVIYAVRDMANSPLQTLVFELFRLENEPNFSDRAGRMARAVERLRELDTLLAAYASHVQLGPKDEAFDSAAVIVEVARTIEDNQ